MKTLEKEIIATLGFFSTFEKALTIEELFENLYRENPMSEIHSMSEMISSLKSLEQKELIEALQARGRIAIKLAGTKATDNTVYNEKLMAKALRWAWIFKLCPFLELVGVCNTLGFNAAKEGSDIDLFIVTSDGRLFLGRTFITLITQALGLRRHGRKISERFCLSFLVDASDQAVYKLALKEDIYFTYWLKNLRIVYARNPDTIEDFASNNKYWVSKYLHHPNFSTEEVKHGKYTLARIAEFTLGGFMGNFFEKFLRRWQLARARKKAGELPDLTGTILTETILKFHNTDRRREIHDKWRMAKQAHHT